MTAPLSDHMRHMVPRWRAPTVAVRAGETSADCAGPNDRFEAEAEEAHRRFVTARGIGSGVAEAIDLLASATVAGRTAFREEALQHLEQHSDLKNLVPERIEPVDLDAALLVARSRAALRADPIDALAWTETARGWVLLGRSDRTDRALRTARQLAPRSTYVARVDVRFLVHRKQFDTAHDLLLRHPRLDVDPWLQATELAVAELAGRHPRSAVRARSAIYADEWAPTHTSELSAAIATLEYNSANARRAKQFAEFSLRSVHDNALAQVIDLQKRGLRIGFDPLVTLGHPLAFEARAQQAYADRHWNEAWDTGVQWRADQEFSSHPALFLSFLAIAGLGDPRRSFDAAEKGLGKNPDHTVLLNNAAFARLVVGDLAEGSRLLARAERRVVAGTAEAAAVSATRGLWHYRNGSPDAGAESYETAHRIATERNESTLALSALIFHAWVCAELGLPRPRRVPMHVSDPALARMSARIEDRSLPLQPVQRPGP